MQQSKIKDVRARRVWDRRGNPTVEVEDHTGSRDGGQALAGIDVRKAVANVVYIIAPMLPGLDATDQGGVDRAILDLDGSALKDRLGGNATMATSLAVIHAAAASKSVPLWRHCADIAGTTPSLPPPEIQIFGGGSHASRRVDIQDFMIVVPGAASFEEVAEVTSEVCGAAGVLMAKKVRLSGVADEGGWWPVFDHSEEALETLVRAIKDAGETPGDRVVISLDLAASEFGKDGRYRLALEDRELSRDELIGLLGRWIGIIRLPLSRTRWARMTPGGCAPSRRNSVIVSRSSATTIC